MTGGFAIKRFRRVGNLSVLVDIGAFGDRVLAHISLLNLIARAKMTIQAVLSKPSGT